MKDLLDVLLDAKQEVSSWLENMAQKHDQKVAVTGILRGINFCGGFGARAVHTGACQPFQLHSGCLSSSSLVVGAATTAAELGGGCYGDIYCNDGMEEMITPKRLTSVAFQEIILLNKMIWKPHDTQPAYALCRTHCELPTVAPLLFF